MREFADVQRLEVVLLVIFIGLSQARVGLLSAVNAGIILTTTTLDSRTRNGGFLIFSGILPAATLSGVHNAGVYGRTETRLFIIRSL